MATPDGPSIGAQQYAEAPDLEQLEQLLYAELESLGIDPHNAASTAPHDGFVFDLGAEVYDLDGPGLEPPAGVKLTWTEVVIGDYNQDGLVGVADLTPLGQHFLEWVQYDDDQEHDGIAWWPSGSPDDFGGVGTGESLPTDCGAYNWRLARIDGDHNCEIYIPDITPIATHWQERLDGYRVYRKMPGDADFVLLPNAADPSMPFTLSRAAAGAGSEDFDNRRPVQFAFSDFEAVEGIIEYKVAPYDQKSDTEGPPSVIVSIDAASGETVIKGLLAVITANPRAGTAPLSVLFDGSQSTAIDGEIASFQWDFDGDGSIDANTGTQPFVEHTYLENARYNAQLTVTNQNGDSRADSIEVVVLSEDGNEPPVIDWDIDDEDGDGDGGTVTGTTETGEILLKGQLPLTVIFDASLSSDADGQIVSYEWDFDGDGLIDEETLHPTASYTYTQNATYLVTLRVTDNAGGIALRRALIIVIGDDGNWPPRAVLTASVVLGAPPLDVRFDASDSTDLDGSIVRHEWDFDGDGLYERDSGVIPVLSHAYGISGLYNVWVRVTDDAGATAIARQLITVNTDPFAALTVSPQQGAVPLDVQLDGSGSVDVDGLIVSHRWDFDGDGIFDLNTGTVSTVRHTYYEVGVFSVLLRVTDQYGASATATAVLSALEPEDNILPLAIIEAYPVETTEDNNVTLDASLSNDPDGAIMRYEWDFDGDRLFDALTNDDPQVMHAYEDAGTYDAAVRVTDNLGSQSTAFVTVKVWSATGNEPPTATLEAIPAGGAPPLEVSFDATGSSDPDGSIVKCEWDLNGDGIFDEDSGTTLTNAKVFTEKGMYYVMVRVTDDENATAKKIVPVTVGFPPVAELTIPGFTDQTPPLAYTGEDPATVCFDASGSIDSDGLITEFCWDLDGNGAYELSTGLSPYLAVEYDLEYWDYDLDQGQWLLRPVVHTPVYDVDLGPVDVNSGPVPLAARVRVKNAIGATAIAELTVTVVDDYDEIEDNDNYTEANHLEGGGPAGEFQPNAPGGNSLTGIREHVFDPFVAGRESLTVVRGNLGFSGYNEDDNDLYSFTLDDGGRVTARLYFNHDYAGPPHGGADLNLRILDSNGITPLCESVSITDNETAAYDFRDAGTYYVRCNRFLGNWADYTLELTAEPLIYFPEDHPGCNNETSTQADDYQLVVESARSYALGRLGEDYSPGGFDMVDYYSFTLTPGGALRVRALFRHDTADLDLELRGPNAELLASAQSVSDNEEILYTLPAWMSGTGYVKVVHAGGDPVNYTLAIEYPAATPVNLTATKGDFADRIVLNWQKGTGGVIPGEVAGGYRVYVADSEYGPYSLAAELGSALSYNYYTEAWHPLWFTVMARCPGYGDSDFSNIDYGYSVGLEPPQNVQATDGEYGDRILITWEPPQTGPAPDAWEVFYSETGGAGWNGWTKIANVDSGTTEYTYYTLPGDLGDWNWFRIGSVRFPYCDGTDSDYTDSVYGSDGGYRSILDQPYNISASQGFWPDKVLVQWMYSGLVAPDKFVIEWKDEYVNGSTKLAEVDGSTFFYYHSTPVSGFYRVHAAKAGYEDGPPSGEVLGFSTGLLDPDFTLFVLIVENNEGMQVGEQIGVQFQGPSSGLYPEEYKAVYWEGATKRDETSWSSWPPSNGIKYFIVLNQNCTSAVDVQYRRNLKPGLQLDYFLYSDWIRHTISH